ncbi:hypothetical protein [Streptomyces sp. CB03238]|uniref:hypothetical protein n=1 Tax=Streptomyces sp. CB03238 TaxID=1907777 RepID=UPI0015C479EC|nr:hypothetical protein [Streptomyces sp. CB03238]
MVGMLRLIASARKGGISAAESFCSCGRYETARSNARVLALIAAHHAHRAQCPLQTEGRNAA